MTSRVWPVAIVAGVVAVYWLRLDFAAGLYVDDAWYMVLAKALAQGDGYALISSAAAPILPAFPPGFPLLLAPVFAFLPEFPANVGWLKSVSMVAMVGVGIAAYRYLVRFHAAPVMVAGTVALLTVLAPAFVFLATSMVMAECAFTLAQLGMALAVERAAREESPERARRYASVAAVIGVAAWLIRSAGIAAVLAGACYLGMRRGWRSAAGFVAVAAVCYAPWLLYASAHRPTDAQRQAHGGSVSFSYGDLLAMKKGGDATSGQIGLGDLPGRIGANLVNVFARDVGAVILPAGYRGAHESGLELVGLGGEQGLMAASMGNAAATMVMSTICSAFVLLGFATTVRRGVTVAEFLVVFTIAMVVVVPSFTFRYVLPLAPFLMFYFLRGVGWVGARMRRVADVEPGPELRISALCLLLLLVIEHSQYVWLARNGPLPLWLRDHRDVQAVSDWMNRNLTSPGFVASTNPGLVYLMTGRHSVGMDGMRTNGERWAALGVRYVVAMRVVQKPAVDLRYRVLYESAGLWVAELPAIPGLTESANRP